MVQATFNRTRYQEDTGRFRPPTVRTTRYLAHQGKPIAVNTNFVTGLKNNERLMSVPYCHVIKNVFSKLENTL